MRSNSSAMGIINSFIIFWVESLRSDDYVSGTEVETVDELDCPSSACLELGVCWSAQCVFLDLFNRNALSKTMMLVDPSVYIVLKSRIRSSSSSTSFPENSLSCPSLDIFARNVESSTHFSYRHIFPEQEVDSIHLFLHRVALVRTSFISPPFWLIETRLNRLRIFGLTVLVLQTFILNLLLLDVWVLVHGRAWRSQCFQ